MLMGVAGKFAMYRLEFSHSFLFLFSMLRRNRKKYQLDAPRVIARVVGEGELLDIVDPAECTRLLKQLYCVKKDLARLKIF